VPALANLRQCFLSSLVVLSACTGVNAVPVGPTSEVSGLRIPSVKPLLVVGAQVQVILVPNFNRAYALQFWAFLAKHDLEAQFQNGMLSSITSNQDSTAVPVAFLAALGQAAQAAKTSLLGAFAGQATGGANVFQIYDIVFDDNGNLVKLIPLISSRDLIPVQSPITLNIPQPPAGGGGQGTTPNPAPVTPLPGGGATPGKPSPAGPTGGH
jgi:hypothetical protein